jgi:hypothetical protein
MHYFQMEFQARKRQEELLHEARKRRLASAVRLANRDDDLLHQLRARRLVGLLWREPGYEASSASVEEAGKGTPCAAGCTKSAGTA